MFNFHCHSSTPSASDSQWLARGCKRQRVATATAGAQAKKGWEAGGKHTLW